MGTGYSVIGFVPPETRIDFSQLYAALQQRFPKWRTVYETNPDSENQSIAIYPDATEWILHVSYKKDAEVSGESPKLSTWIARDDAERDRIAACRIWIQISSPPDYKMVYFNYFAWTMGWLEQVIPDVPFWDTITGEWLPEKD